MKDFTTWLKVGFIAAIISAITPTLGVRGGAAWAGDFSFSNRADIDLTGLYRHVNEVGLSEYNDVGDGVGTASILSQASFKNLQFEVMPEYLFHYGSGASVASSDPAYLSIAPPRRFLPIQWEVDSLQYQEGYVDVEHLSLSYLGQSFQCYVGRKPVSLGVLKIFPVWNKFTRASPVAVGPEAMIFSQDSAGFKLQLGPVAISATEIKGGSSDQDAAIVEATLYTSAIEIHVLGAQWWESPVAGLAISTDLFGATFRFEGLAIGPTASATVIPIIVSNTGMEYPNPLLGWEGQTGAGIEYAFTDKLSSIAEGLWQQKGATSAAYYTIVQNNPFELLRAEWYSFEQLKYKLTPTFTLTPGILDNWIDISHYAVFNADYSMTDNTDISLTVAGPIGNSGSEFATQSFFLSNSTSVGAPFQVSLDLHFTF